MGETRKLAAILCSDVVGYSRLAGADEDRILARLRALRSDLIDPTIAVHNGRIVKRTGDGSIVEFRSVVDAVRCAIEVQNAMVERNAGVTEDRRIVFRIGIHLGDVVEESDGDLMGDGVNIAARLEGVARPGAICLSEDAYRQVKQRLDVAVVDLGEQKLKNIAEPVRAFSVEVGKPGPGPQAKARIRRFPARAVAAIAAFALAAVAVAAWWIALNRATPTATASPHAPTVLVAPLVNATGETKFDATTRRISDKLIGYLSGSLFWKTVKGADAGAEKSSNADYVLEGNLEGGGAELRISVHLSDARSGARLWATTIAPILEDPGTAKAEDEVAGHAAAVIRYPIREAELRRLEQSGQSENAYGCLLKIGLLRPAEIVHLRECEEAAVVREPKNAFAWEGLAIVLGQQRFFAWGLPPDEASSEKRDALAGRIYDAYLRAKELAPDDIEIQSGFVWGNYARCDADRVRVEVAKTIALNPYYDLGWIGTVLAYIGDWDEGVAMTERGIKLAGPAAHPFWWWPSAYRHFDRGEYQAAYDDFQRGYIENWWELHFHLAYTLVYLGRFDEAKAQLKTALALYPALSVREAEGWFKIVCFSKSYRDKAVAALRKIGTPE